jgi:hypothetical protein
MVNFDYILCDYKFLMVKVKGKVNLVQAWNGPSGSRRLKLPEFLDNQHMKVARLSVLRTGRLYPQGRFLVLISVRGRVDSRVPVRQKRLSQWKISMTPSGIQSATFRPVEQCLNDLMVTISDVRKQNVICKHIYVTMCVENRRKVRSRKGQVCWP